MGVGWVARCPVAGGVTWWGGREGARHTDACAYVFIGVYGYGCGYICIFPYVFPLPLPISVPISNLISVPISSLIPVPVTHTIYT